YAAQEYKPELQNLKDNLAAMTEQYVKAVEAVAAVNDTAYTDFMARRMVEMAGNIIMGYLLLNDANRNETFVKSATVYNKLAQAEVAKHADFIANFNPAQLDFYKA
ncbi:MAG: acyl-CoA dehydrogenase, partial [Muribaculaceae bacterium]|nr:acyl-CoA dehydrogenase [Muribaculaceae bacterium]